MNLTVLFIAAWLPLLLILFVLLRSGSFGKGSMGMLLKLFFLGVAASVPAFLMEAGALLVLNLLFGVFPESAFGGNRLLVCALMQCFLAAALIEELWKHFILRVTTWEKMTMETVADGIAAAGVVSTGFSAAIYGFWQAGHVLVPADMELLRNAMPAFLSAGPVLAFLYAILFILGHFGFSGFMGALYGVAKGSEQKQHGARAGIMLFLSGLLPILLHGLCATLIEYGIAAEGVLWAALGLAAQTILALLMASVLNSASDAKDVDSLSVDDEPVDFADSEEFAEFAEAAGGELSPVADQDAAPSDFASADQDAAIPDLASAGQDAAFSDFASAGQDAAFSDLASDGAETPARQENQGFAQGEDLEEAPEQDTGVPDEEGIIDV